MNRFFKNKVTVVLSSLSILTLLLAVVGITYAYFTANVNGNDKASSILVNTGVLSVNFMDGPQVSLPNAMPGASTTKTFKVINTGTVPVHYNIRWDKVINTFTNKNELMYEVKRSNGKVITGNAVAPEYNEYLPGARDIVIEKDEIHTYVFDIKFMETGSNQNENQGKTFSGVLQVLEFKAGEADSLIIENPTVNNLNLTASLKDNTNSVVGYAVTYDTGALKTINNNTYKVRKLNDSMSVYNESKGLVFPTSWIKIEKTSLFNINVNIIDYDATLWVKNEAGLIKYQELTPYNNLTIDPDGGTWETFTTPQTYNLKYKSTKNISSPTKTGYTFTSWNIVGTDKSHIIGNVFTMGEKATTLKAKYLINRYNLTVDPAGGIFDGKTIPSVYSLEYNSNKQIETPSKEGYTFTGWVLSSTLSSLNTNMFTMGAEPCTLTASWQVNTYPYITYHNKQNVSGTGYTLVTADTEEKSAAFGSTVTPSVKTYSGFTSPSAKSLTIKTSGNILNYNYNRNKYDLVVNPNGGSYNNQTTNTIYNIYYEEEKVLGVPSKIGYNFVSWNKTGSGVLTDNKLKQGVGATTLTASYSPQIYTINYNPNGGTVSPISTTVTYDSTYGVLATPVRENHEFLGWFTDQTNGIKIEPTSKVTITSAQTLYAHWKNLAFNISLVISGGLSDTTEYKGFAGEKIVANLNPNAGYSTANVFVKCKNGTSGAFVNNKVEISSLSTHDSCNVVLQRDVSYSASSVTYTIPFTGNYIINSYGAQGEGNGGKGGYIQVNKRFTEGEVLTILTGGQDGTNGGGSGFKKGGGASSVSLNNTKIIVSAGGGGASDNSAGNPGGSGNGSGGSNIGGGAGSSGSNGGGGGSSYNTTACDSGSYSCNSGDSLSGSTCSHFDQYTFGSSAQCSGVSPDNSCSPGYSKSYYCDSCAGKPDGTWVSCTGICTSSYSYGASYYPGSCYLYYGYPGNGGTNVVSGVTATVNSSGINAGNGKVDIHLAN